MRLALLCSLFWVAVACISHASATPGFQWFAVIVGGGSSGLLIAILDNRNGGSRD